MTADIAHAATPPSPEELAAVITPDYVEPICVPADDARGAVLVAS